MALETHEAVEGQHIISRLRMPRNTWISFKPYECAFCSPVIE